MPAKSKEKQNTYRILFIGDIIGESGRNAVKKILPKIKAQKEINYVIANGEHLSDRVGIDADTLFEMRDAGIDFFTSGNHVWRQSDFKEEITKKNMPIVRPANFLAKCPGHGFRILDTPAGKMLIINLLGKEGINEKVVNPFKKIDAILESQKGYRFALVDFHAEMTSEKVAMGQFLDGRVAAVLGTHTHVPTADAKILPKGTAFVSDVGMTGPENSVLGVKSEIIIERFIKGASGRFEVAEGAAVFNAVMLTLDEKGNILKIERVDRHIK